MQDEFHFKSWREPKKKGKKRKVLTCEERESKLKRVCVVLVENWRTLMKAEGWKTFNGFMRN